MSNLFFVVHTNPLQVYTFFDFDTLYLTFPFGKDISLFFDKKADRKASRIQA
jgi:hypothetical protein